MPDSISLPAAVNAISSATKLTPLGAGDTPHVTWDPINHEILANVIVLPPKTAGGPLVVHAPLIAIPGPLPTKEKSQWTVIWTLVPGEGLNTPHFADGRGITLPSQKYPSLPDEVKIFDKGGKVQNRPDQWQAVIENGVIAANSFQYDIVIDPHPADLGLAIRVTRHDPTIAVIKDPLDPPV
jgi:hypothetical protein